MARRILTPKQWRSIGTTVVDSTKRFVPTAVVKPTVPTARRVWSTGSVSWTPTDRS